MELRESKIGQIYTALMHRTILVWLQNLGPRPNTVTGIGLGIACLVPLGFALGAWVGLIVLLLSGMADSLDGLLARSTKQESAFGAFWDSTLDRAADSAYLLGFLVLFWPVVEQLFLAVAGIFAAQVLTLLISYTKARLESQGEVCASGLMTRPVRTIFLGLWALAVALFSAWTGVILWAGLGLYLVLTLISVGQRVQEARERLGSRKESASVQG